MTDAADLRQRIEELAADDGRFRVACARTGERPTPVTSCRFPTREAAASAAALASEYREALREVDPDLPERDLEAYAASDDPVTLVSTRERAGGRRENGLPRTSRSVTLTGEGEREWLRMDNAPLVHIRREGEPLDDAAIERQLDAKL